MISGSTPSGLRRQAAAVGRQTSLAVVALALAGLALAAGCGKDPAPGLVPVSGKITYHGGSWPKEGMINFASVKPAEGFPNLPGAARFDTDGNFVVKCGERDGLMPGEYRAVVRCWDEAPGHGGAGKSLVPRKYFSPYDSPLKLTVEKGSKPITLDWNVPEEAD